MTLRFLLYVAREYDKILDNKNIYNKAKLVKIPKPDLQFYIVGKVNMKKQVCFTYLMLLGIKVI